jgi:hypothetical protein
MERELEEAAEKRALRYHLKDTLDYNHSKAAFLTGAQWQQKRSYTNQIDLVAMINARINMYQKADANDPFYQGAIAALSSLSDELQMSIDADVAAMESNTGE